MNKYDKILSKQKSLNEVNAKYGIWDVSQPLCIVDSGELYKFLLSLSFYFGS